MPRKSRKQKIISKERSQTKFHQAGIVKTLVRDTTPTQNSVATETTLKTVSFFTHDLRKSILLVVAIIALEIIFYFASMSTVWDKLFKF